MEEHATPMDGQEHSEQIEHTPADESREPVRRRLGRGLNALLGAGDDEAGGAVPAEHPVAAAAGHEAGHVSVELIERNPFQPRRDFDEQALTELADSIRQHGLLQPVLVRPYGGGYQIVAGERRWLAAKQAGLETVPCRVLELEDKSVCEVALEENLKRKDLNVLEKAQAFQDYLERFGSTIEELAQKLSLNRSTVSNFIRLLELPDPVKKALRSDRISNGHARAMLSLPQEDQVALCKRIQSESLSVRKTEEAVRDLLEKGEQGEPGEQADTIPFQPADQPHDEGRTNHVLSLQDQLRDHFGVQVEIKVKGKDAGRIILHFTNNDEFERIVQRMRHAA